MLIRFDDNDVAVKVEPGIENVEVDEEEGGTSSRVEEEEDGPFRGNDQRKCRKDKRRINGHYEAVSNITYQQGLKLIKKNQRCGLVEILDKRHMTIGWHYCGHAMDAIKRILQKSIGRYRPQLKAVPLAIGEVTVRENGRVIGVQSCMHLDVTTHMIVFRPRFLSIYGGVVTSVSRNKRHITAKLYKSITLNATIRKNADVPNVGDSVRVQCRTIAVKGPVCQVKGAVLRPQS